MVVAVVVVMVVVVVAVVVVILVVVVLVDRMGRTHVILFTSSWRIKERKKAEGTAKLSVRGSATRAEISVSLTREPIDTVTMSVSGCAASSASTAAPTTPEEVAVEGPPRNITTVAFLTGSANILSRAKSNAMDVFLTSVKFDLVDLVRISRNVTGAREVERKRIMLKSL